MKSTMLSTAFLGLVASTLAAPAPVPASFDSWGSEAGRQAASANQAGPSATSAPSPQATAPAGSGDGTPTGNSTSPGGLALPEGCMKKNGLGIGWLPDEDNGGTMGPITDKVGGKACFYGLYSQITSTQYDASQLTSRMADIMSSGAILQAAVMPTKVKFSQVDSDLAGQVCGAMKQFTDQGIQVWLRFAHEFNYYVTDGTYAGGSPDEFVTMWKTLSGACKSNDMIKMYWSPNNVGNNADSLDAWWPGADSVDVVGIDVYPKEGTDFDGAYGAFYKAFAEKYNKPFYIGETGQTAGDSAKKEWLQDLVQPSSDYPLYGGLSWFEYNKNGQDFRIALGDEDIAKEVLG